MELLTPEVLKRILVQSGEKDDLERVLSSGSEAAVGHGENYCSNISRTHLKLKLTSGKILEKSLLIKIFVQNLGEEALREMERFFANEASMYNKILNQLENLAMASNLPNPRAWPQCYLADSNLIILEDLKEAGFDVAPRHDGYNLEDALEIIKFIGRFHGLSVAAENRKLIDCSIIRRVYTWVNLDNWSGKFITYAFKISGKIIQEWGGDWIEPGKKISNYSDRISKDLNDLFMEDVKMKVINHGDVWINNIMIKRGEDKQTKSLRFIDFQNSTYNSIGWDLTYFLYSSLKAKTLRSNYEKLLTSYRNEFVHTLVRLGEDASVVPTLDEIKADVVRLHPFALAVSLTIQAAVFNVSKDLVQLDDLISNESKLRTIYSSDNWESSVKVHIKYFQEQNLL